MEINIQILTQVATNVEIGATLFYDEELDEYLIVAHNGTNVDPSTLRKFQLAVNVFESVCSGLYAEQVP